MRKKIIIKRIIAGILLMLLSLLSHAQEPAKIFRVKTLNALQKFQFNPGGQAMGMVLKTDAAGNAFWEFPKKDSLAIEDFFYVKQTTGAIDSLKLKKELKNKFWATAPAGADSSVPGYRAIELADLPPGIGGGGTCDTCIVSVKQVASVTRFYKANGDSFTITGPITSFVITQPQRIKIGTAGDRDTLVTDKVDFFQPGYLSTEDYTRFYLNTDSTYLKITDNNRGTIPLVDKGILLQNTTAAINNNPGSQYPPMLRFAGQYWASNLSESRTTAMSLKYAPTGTPGPSTGNVGTLQFIADNGNGAITTPFTFGLNGAMACQTLSINGSIAVLTAGISVVGGAIVSHNAVTGGVRYVNRIAPNWSGTMASPATLYGNYVISTSAPGYNITAVANGNDFGDNNFNTAGGRTTIGANINDDFSTVLNVEDTTRGSKPVPTMTKAQRNRIHGKPVGTITNAGSAYTNVTVFNKAMTGGTGFGMTAAITIAGNIVTSVIIQNAGRGYTTGDVLSSFFSPGSGFTFTLSAVPKPPVGLLVWQTDNTAGLRSFNGTDWIKFTETTDN